MANMETPRSPSVQSFASVDTISIAFTSTPGSPVSNSAAPHGEHEETDVAEQAHRFYLKDGNLKIQLDEGTFYNVHRHFFERHAPRFAENYLRGEQPDLIQLHDVSSVDFQRFLSIIYPSDLGICDIYTVDEWTSVLRLASQWSVARLRDVAIREIGALGPTPIESIVIAREFGLGPTWLVPAFVALCRASEPLGYEDAERLGLRTVVEIARINREEFHAYGPYEVEAAVRASDVLLSPSAKVSVQHATSQPAPTTPILVPTSDAVPTPAGALTPAVSHDPGHASKLDRARYNSSEYRSISDINDNMAYMAMVAEEDAHARLLQIESFSSGTVTQKEVFALRVARRLVTDTSAAATRHRSWRQLWLQLEGYSGVGRTVTQESTIDARAPEDVWISTLCLGVILCILKQLDLCTQEHLLGKPTPPCMYLTVRVQKASPKYPASSSIALSLHASDRLCREGLSWTQDADDAACMRVLIPSPSRKWFVRGP
ncbi:hypothetical protein GGG16DRAFT_61161 [Schizophyllum commune]